MLPKKGVSAQIRVEHIRLTDQEASRLRLREAWQAWLLGVEWHWLVTLTFEGNASEMKVLSTVRAAIHRINIRLFGRNGRRAARCWSVAIMEHTKAGDPHVHILLSTPQGVHRRCDIETAIATYWEEKFGLIRIESVRSSQRAVRYVTKGLARRERVIDQNLPPRWHSRRC